MIRAFAALLVLSAVLIMPASAQLPTMFVGSGSFGGIALTGQCPNQLILIYSNSCALIGQGWGE
jgi:hypothetical protein